MNTKSYDILLKQISKNIKKTRINKGENMDHGFNYRHYQKIESFILNLYTLYRLSQIFKVKIIQFFKD